MDIQVASTQVLEEADDNNSMKVSLGELHLHEELSLEILLKRPKLSTLLSAFLELC